MNSTYRIVERQPDDSYDLVEEIVGLEPAQIALLLLDATNPAPLVMFNADTGKRVHSTPWVPYVC